ncbi:hypothetical protein GR328_08440 [Microvirga makkahensis]|uniref:MAPEG family protein n=2 Tax=Microvirga makkahensis TaxID=1128670 RepID=A0A7X3MQP6_9HYPH|nr:hypothetical protein [Microvirga makkahensis]
MTTELTLLAWTLVLALVQILLPATLRTGETGVSYNASARDHEGPPVGKITGRLQRAQSNLFETLPVVATAIVIAHFAGRNGALTWWGAMLYFWARIVYLPLYALGIPYIRSVVWLVSLLGIILILVAILLPAA